jgi:hypothetical protein
LLILATVTIRNLTIVNPPSDHRQEDVGPRVARYRKMQKRSSSLNYLVLAVAFLIAVYVAVTILRPIFFSIRPGTTADDLGCVARSNVSSC